MSLLVALKRNGTPLQQRDVTKRRSTLERELMGLESPIPLQPRRRGGGAVVSPETDADDDRYDDCYSLASDPDETLGSFFVNDDSTELATTDKSTDESIFPGDSGNVLLNFDDLDLTVQSLACRKLLEE
jgi:hypothetical protein